MSEPMKDLLEKVDAELQVHFPEVHASLQPSVTEERLQALESLLECQALPEDLAMLYRWHDGQGGGYSLNQNDNRSFLSVEEVLDAWDFLNDPEEDVKPPISPTWLPIFYNGAGDYLMYETAEADRGRLIAYWHDADDRSVEHESLESLVMAVWESARKKKE
ncbi:SMI1/KNR4 family protein [Hydrogenophaga sp. 5NK40-0174]|uniref:SMI1/KNR4 family protein n=1 Tax=Hydrogenophaga sp. 5NK40-0174 TaxID=3127649 RepID=UPI0031022D2B